MKPKYFNTFETQFITCASYRWQHGLKKISTTNDSANRLKTTQRAMKQAMLGIGSETKKSEEEDKRRTWSR